MSQRRVSPSRSQGGQTPRRRKTRATRSVGSPTSSSSGRLSAVIQFKDVLKESFILSPVPTRRSVLNDDTDIEEPRRKSWWKKLSENSRDVMDALSDNKILETNEAMEEYIDFEVLSQEKKNYTVDLPDSSDNESISSIVIPQRKLFTQKENQPQKKFGQLIGTRESLAKLQKTIAHEKTVNVAPKKLFGQASRPRSKPIFPAALLNLSPNKTVNKTREISTAPVECQGRNLFGNRPDLKRKNMFADFIVSESEDEISEIQPHVFAFQNKMEKQAELRNKRRRPSDASSLTDDRMDEWKHLPSSTMVENQLEDIIAATTHVQKRKESVENIQNKKSQAIDEDTSKIEEHCESANKEDQQSKRNVEESKDTCIQEQDQAMSDDDCENLDECEENIQNKESQAIDEDDCEMEEHGESVNKVDQQSNPDVTETCIREQEQAMSDDDYEKDVNEEDLQNKENQAIGKDNSKIGHHNESAKMENQLSNQEDKEGADTCAQEEDQAISDPTTSPPRDSSLPYIREGEVDVQKTKSQAINKDNSKIEHHCKSANKEDKQSNQEVKEGEITSIRECQQAMSEDVSEKSDEGEVDVQKAKSQAIHKDNSKIEHHCKSANKEDKQSNQEVKEGEITSIRECQQAMSEDVSEKSDGNEKDAQNNEKDVHNNEKDAIGEQIEHHYESTNKEDQRSNQQVKESEDTRIQERDQAMSEINSEKPDEREEDEQNKKSQDIDEDNCKIEEQCESVNKEHQHTNQVIKESEDTCIQEQDQAMPDDDYEKLDEGEENVQNNENQAIDKDMSKIEHHCEYANKEDQQSNQEVKEGENTCIQERDKAISEGVSEKPNESKEDVQNKESKTIDKDNSKIEDHYEYRNEEHRQSNQKVKESEDRCMQEQDQAMSDGDPEGPDEREEDVQNTDNQAINEDNSEIVDHCEHANEEDQQLDQEVKESEETCIQEQDQDMSEDDSEEPDENEEDVQNNESQAIDEDNSETEDRYEYANEEDQQSNHEVSESEDVTCAQERDQAMSEDDSEKLNESEEDVQNTESQAVDEVNSEIEDNENTNEEDQQSDQVEESEETCIQEEDQDMSEDDSEKPDESEEDVQNTESQAVDEDNSEIEDHYENANEDDQQSDQEASEETCIQEQDPDMSEDEKQDVSTEKNNEAGLNSPEVIRHDKTKQMQSFTVKGRNTSLRRSSILRSMNLKPSLAPPRNSTGLSDGTNNSSAEGSGWDSHRTTRKTLRQTFGKDFSPRKSLRALVMEKSANRQTNVNDLTSVTSKFPQANSTELPEVTYRQDDNDLSKSNHEVSKRTRQTTLELYLEKIKKQNMEKKLKMEEVVRNSLKAPIRDISNTFKVPSRHVVAKKPKQNQGKTKAKPKSTLIQMDDLPQEVIEDMKYKPPKRFKPNNAAWITKRLYKFLENKLEPKYDYKARVRAEKLVEALYQFSKDLRRQEVASRDAVDVLKHEMARLNVVTTHFEFYQFFDDYMPREIRVKVVPDIVNKIPLPRHGVFSDILHGNSTQA